MEQEVPCDPVVCLLHHVESINRNAIAMMKRRFSLLGSTFLRFTFGVIEYWLWGVQFHPFGFSYFSLVVSAETAADLQCACPRGFCAVKRESF